MRSICILSSVRDQYLEVKIRARDKQYSSCLLIPETKGTKILQRLTSMYPRRAQYLHNAWKKHQDAVFWVDINLAIKKELQFYQTRWNAIILQETLPAHCIPKVVRMKTGEVIYEKVYMSPRPPPKISLQHEWTRELGSKVARQPEGEVARQANSSQPTPNPIRVRSERPDNMQDGRNTYRSQEIDVNSFCNLVLQKEGATC